MVLDVPELPEESVLFEVPSRPLMPWASATNGVAISNPIAVIVKSLRMKKSPDPVMLNRDDHAGSGISFRPHPERIFAKQVLTIR